VSYQVPPDIEALIQQQIATGQFQTPDQVLRIALEQLAAQEEAIRAIQVSIDALEAGDPGIPVDDAFAAIRAKYNIPSDA
jgi:Arc/MetJ-type ribon-helix-helix transcriptional regulator